MARRVLVILGICAAFIAGWLSGRRTALPPVPPAPAAAPAAPAVDPSLPIPPAPVALTPVEPEPAPTAADYPEIIDALRSGSLDAPALLGAPLTPATLPDFLARAGSKVRFSATATHSVMPGAKTMLEMLPGSIAYWRPRTLDPAETNRLVKEWALWRAARPVGLIIDLRFTADPNNFAGAAPAAALFATPGRTLFTLQALDQAQQVFKSERQPLDIPSWMPVLVLTHRRTRGAGEALAHALRVHARALLTGQPTAGEAGLYREIRLKSGLFVRVATARAAGADGTELFGTPLEPDLWVEIDPAQEKRAWQTAASQSAVATLVEPPALPRLHQENGGPAVPEAEPSTPAPPADPVLKAAVDAIIALQVRPVPPARP